MKKHLKDFLIPHEGNDYKPHSLEKAAMSGMVVLVLLSFILANLQSLIWVSSEWMVSTILPSVIVDLTNEEREDSDLLDLRRNPILDRAAQLKAEHMAANEYFSHYSPSGISPWHWFSEAGYNYVHAGENLAIHFSDSDAVVDAWMDSPTHRANIVNSDYTEIGVGAVEGEYEGYTTVYIVQLFGTPAAIAATPEPVIEQEVFAQDPEPVVLAETENVAVATSGSSEVAPIADPFIAASEEIIAEIDDTEVSLSTDRDPVPVTPTTTQETVAETEIVETVTTEQSVALYSDLISTTTGGVPATIDPDMAGTSESTPGIAAIATKPQLVLQILYMTIALFVVMALALAIFIEIRRQNPLQIAYSMGLMGAMALLLYVHISLTGGALII